MNYKSNWRTVIMSLLSILLFTFSFAQDEKVLVIGHAETTDAYLSSIWF